MCHFLSHSFFFSFGSPDPITSAENNSSGFPSKKNLPFLKKLGLKAVILLCPECYSDAILDFMGSNDTKVYQVGLEGNKEPFVDISESNVRRAISYIIDPANQPILVHCNKGKVTKASLLES